MPKEIENLEQEIVERLFAEFNEQLRSTGKADFMLLDKCPVTQRRELRSLMNVAAMAYHALADERSAQDKNDDTHPMKAVG